MSTDTVSILEPSFIEGVAGQLYVIHHRPDDSIAHKGSLIFVPPFNEEMNRSRSMVTMLARALNSIGIGLVLVDLYGTGDSGGNYVDGNWEVWKQDIVQVASWLDREGHSCSGLLGLRLGALLAADVIATVSEFQFGKLLFWQPVTEGKTHLVQFLRIRLAANLERQTKDKETTKFLKTKLVDEGSVEVAGYEVSRELGDAIDRLKLSDYIDGLKNTPVLWLEHRNEPDQPISTSLSRTLSKYEENGLEINFNTFVGPAFWQMHERTLAPEVIRKTIDWLKQT